jgi:2',3'-cyclic-nucleotide 2'-phosphodiesterase (5'-nucleotidase family)
MKRHFLNLLLFAFIIAGCLSQPIYAQTNETVRVTILHVNDVYQFTPVEGGTRGGLARLLTLKQQIKQENPNLLFTLGGDTLSPSVETRTYKARR